jgi:hypothetical protein
MLRPRASNNAKRVLQIQSVEKRETAANWTRIVQGKFLGAPFISLRFNRITSPWSDLHSLGTNWKLKPCDTCELVLFFHGGEAEPAEVDGARRGQRGIQIVYRVPEASCRA